MTAALPDPAASRAVLIGVSEYRSMPGIPAAERNVRGLAALLTDPTLWGLPPEHCRVVIDPTSSEEVLRAVHEASMAATDALVVYFAGHGLLDDIAELYLALPEASRERLWGAVRFADVRREMITAARGCRAKVVLLDCCYSGRAMSGFMSGPGQLADQAVVDGAYLMTATAENMPAIAAVGAEYTAFTGALVQTLRDGVLGGPRLLDMDTLFTAVDQHLHARNHPRPQRRSRNDGHRIAIARNRAAATPPGGAPDDERVGEVAPPGRGSGPGRRWTRHRSVWAGALGSLLLLLAIIGWQADLLGGGPNSPEGRSTTQRPGTSNTPSRTTPSGPTSSDPTPPVTGPSAATVSPAPARGGPPVVIVLSEDPDDRDKPVTGSTPDGSIRIGVHAVSTNDQRIGFSVVTDERSCMVSAATVGQSLVLPESAGGWVRIVVDDVRSKVIGAQKVVYRGLLSVSRGAGKAPRNNLACN
ncbi:caspase family protein [Micromonospora sp. NIE79]|uniref:Caspase family protein n=1 Tax=Micromonospora trifolii TaxID=2911208 RepID=A0ABS9N8E9_9ACTN|nr:caspase family protein [Micromonospora trifolii]MCG5445930.1 caspase family protein [Micromonospora trifolii]